MLHENSAMMLAPKWIRTRQSKKLVRRNYSNEKSMEKKFERYIVRCVNFKL